MNNSENSLEEYMRRGLPLTLHTQNQLLLIKRDMTCRQQGLAG